MAAITAALVKELREKSGAGMMDCKKALGECDGDIDAAIEHLRKVGVLKAEKKSGRIAAEGLIDILQEGALASIVEVNCETDFVAKNADYLNFLAKVSQCLHKTKPADLGLFLESPFLDEGKSVSEKLTELIAVIGENITVRRFELMECSAGEKIGTYSHMGNKIGVLVKVKGDQVNDETLKDIAMHIAAASPRYLRSSDIPSVVIEKEKEIYRENMKDEKKPAEIIEKIIEGKVRKFASDVCLEEQIYVKDPNGKQNVAAFLKTVDPTAQIVSFARLQVGEGIEKKADDFAEEVAKMAQ